MTPEQQRIAIAEACGYVLHPSVDHQGHAYPEYWTFGGVDAQFFNWTELPNYPEDLNAMHDAEKTLSADDFPRYRVLLAELCTGYALPEWQGYAISATSDQRSVAFLRTIGKWKD